VSATNGPVPDAHQQRLDVPPPATRPKQGLPRWADLLIAVIALILVSPILLAAAIAIRLSSRGPVIYRQRRVGRDGVIFEMFKLRTMHAASCSAGSAITAHRDSRVFPFGAWLRRTKIDELPQLVNILRGDMSVVGPRPEDPRIVADHYGPVGRETLAVRPGLTSPGSLYSCLEGEHLIDAADPEASYLRNVLPRKLGLDATYVRTTSLRVDFVLLARTIGVITGRLVMTAEARDRQDAARARQQRETARVTNPHRRPCATPAELLEGTAPPETSAQAVPCPDYLTLPAKQGGAG